jgi:hypothetical protein
MTNAHYKPVVESEVKIDDTVEHTMDPAPRWFTQTYGETSAREMADRYVSNRPAPAPLMGQPIIAENASAYEAYRKRLEDRFSSAQRMADPSYIPQDNEQSQSTSAFPNRPNYAHGLHMQQQVTARRKTAPGFSPITLGLLALAACGIGGGAGYIGANPDKASALFTQGYSLASLLWAAPIGPATETVVVKKSVQTAKLEVKDATGAINTPIPLDISAFPADVETPVALRISGLPPSAYLTKGVEVAQGEWMLKASDVAQAELVVPHSDGPEIALQISALDEKTGALAAPSQDLLVALDLNAVPVPGVPQPKIEVALIEPAAAVPDQGFNKQELPLAVPVPLESADPEAQSLIRKGERLLKTGDILAARQFFLRAFEMKATLAAYGVGQTYDPAVYARHNIRGLTPSPQQAAEWYGKAAAIGHSEASAALAELAVPVQP